MKSKNILKQFSTIILLVIMVIFFAVMTDTFFAAKNMINILRQVAVLGILSAGMTFVIISGGMDLTVGSLLGLTGVVCAKFLVEYQMNSVVAILLTLVILTLFGTITGLLIVKLHVAAIVITLGMMTVARGLAFIISGGLPIYDIPEGVVTLGQGYVGAIPIPVITMLVIVVIAAFILNRTYYGRYVYAIGGNEEAARLAGVAVDKIKVSLYSASAFLAGIAGVTLMARVSSGAPASGTSMEMDVVTAVVIGGVSINGGKGKISGAFIGALIIGVLSNGLTIMNIGEYYQQVVKGLVLILAVAFDVFTNTDRIKKVKSA
ncbi:ABC transporter permease [Diplocloster agilis]|uniref:ABC transporter permease n=1 Tax=Diplocloster agilis TaxID=2850323 RepID=A0A949K1J2_9FIRM|nr:MULTISPECIES: ABC transporter permease [Lachnospiraceae]MBU9738494.1 ABC transporter permease [Diplocloster agilis]MCU6733881.1 ABC transporter permease [Suonthocola fibrivorans]SCJ13787.1 Ribose transport system permease protein rbsC [uncultured Clostridium sp.]